MPELNFILEQREISSPALFFSGILLPEMKDDYRGIWIERGRDDSHGVLLADYCNSPGKR